LRLTNGLKKRLFTVSVDACIPFAELTRGISFRRVRLALISIIKAERELKPGEEVVVDNMTLFAFMLIAAPTWTNSVVEALRAAVAAGDTGADSQVIALPEYPGVEVVMQRRSVVAVRPAKE
jgi:hypothetical protein